MHKACVAAGAGLAGAMALAAGLACAAEDDGDLYVVNAAGRPVTVIVDGAHVADLPRLGTAHRPLPAGGHGVAIVIGGRVASVWQDFGTVNVSLNAAGRPAWCYLATRADAAPSLQLLDPGQCRQLILAGPPESVAYVQPPRR